MNDDKVFGVHLSGPNNSTMFTDCCGAAICEDQQRCPECRELVIGWDAETDAKRDRVRSEACISPRRCFCGKREMASCMGNKQT